MRWLILFSLVLFLFLFESCAALKKRKHEPQVMETVEVSKSIDSALETPDFEEGKWPAYNWWTMFSDDQLNQIMDEAIENNPSLMAAVSRLRASQEEAKKVRSSLIPQLSASFNDNYQHLSKDDLYRFPPSRVPAVVNEVITGLNFEYEIDLFGKNRNLYRAAMGQARSQAAETAQSLLMITTSLAESYFNYSANLLDLQVSRDMAKAQKTYLELTELRMENGIDDQMMVDQAAADLLEMEEVVIFYEVEVEVNKTQIKVLMGLSPDDPRAIEFPTASFDRPFPLPENIPVNLLARRPDLMAQIWTVEAAAHLINAAKAAFFPNINLTAFVGLATLSWGKLFSHNSFSGSINPAISLPLFTGGRLTAQLGQEYANYDMAVHNYNSLILQAAKEVVDRVKILEGAGEEVRLQSAVLERVMNVSDLTYQRYENGVDDYLTVLEKQIGVMKQGIKEVGIQNKRHLAAVSLVQSLGGGYHGSEP